jgi:hypothetical protein
VDIAVIAEIPLRHAIGDPLVAQGRHQPIEQDGRVVLLDRSNDALLAQSRAEIVDQIGLPRELTDPPYKVDGVSSRRAGRGTTGQGGLQ